MRIFKRQKALAFFKNMKVLLHRISAELSEVKTFLKRKKPLFLSEITKKLPF
jgi:hypothetical protein